jgi:hypothetical protein
MDPSGVSRTLVIVPARSPLARKVSPTEGTWLQIHPLSSCLASAEVGELGHGFLAEKTPLAQAYEIRQSQL